MKTTLRSFCIFIVLHIVIIVFGEEKKNETISSLGRRLALREYGPFTFTTSQSYTFPPNVASVMYTMYGCNGDYGNGQNTLNQGGEGEYLFGTFDFDSLDGISASTTLYLNICNGQSGGVNGDSSGGAGGTGGPAARGGYGGGATDIRYRGNDIQNRILVAAGGGGGGYASTSPTIGGDGGPVGGVGASYGYTLNKRSEVQYCDLVGISLPNGGSQSSGGKGGCKKNDCANNGEIGKGGQGYSRGTGGSPGGGGGGGYFGGGGGNGCGGAGGSSYVDPRIYYLTIQSVPYSTPKTGSIIISYVVYPTNDYTITSTSKYSADGSIIFRDHAKITTDSKIILINFIKEFLLSHRVGYFTVMEKSSNEKSAVTTLSEKNNVKSKLWFKLETVDSARLKTIVDLFKNRADIDSFFSNYLKKHGNKNLQLVSLKIH